MDSFLAGFEHIFTYVVTICVFLMEITGIAVLMVSATKGLIGWIKGRENVKLELSQGIALALTFKLCGELMRTLIVRELHELLVLAIVIALRTAMAFLIHWEIKNEKKEGAKQLW